LLVGTISASRQRTIGFQFCRDFRLPKRGRDDGSLKMERRRLAAKQRSTDFADWNNISKPPTHHRFSVLQRFQAA